MSTKKVMGVLLPFNGKAKEIDLVDDNSYASLLKSVEKYFRIDSNDKKEFTLSTRYNILHTKALCMLFRVSNGEILPPNVPFDEIRIGNDSPAYGTVILVWMKNSNSHYFDYIELLDFKMSTFENMKNVVDVEQVETELRVRQKLERSIKDLSYRVKTQEETIERLMEEKEKLLGIIDKKKKKSDAKNKKLCVMVEEKLESIKTELIATIESK